MRIMTDERIKKWVGAPPIPDGRARRIIGIGVLSVFLASPALGAGMNSSPIDSAQRNNGQAPAADAMAESLHAALGGSPVGDAELGEVRAGFKTANGLEFNVGFELKTIINGAIAAHHNWNSDTSPGHSSGHFGVSSIRTIISGDGEGATVVSHDLGSGGFNTLIVNTQNGVNIEQTNTLTIDVLNHTSFINRVTSGMLSGAGAGLPNIIKDALINSIAR